MARTYVGKQQRDEPPRTHEGTLYEAGQSGRIRGRGDENAAKPELAGSLNTRP
jgi:hypothetical protein